MAASLTAASEGEEWPAVLRPVWMRTTGLGAGPGCGVCVAGLPVSQGPPRTGDMSGQDGAVCFLHYTDTAQEPLLRAAHLSRIRHAVRPGSMAHRSLHLSPLVSLVAW